jgi:hypothetical protein
MKSSLAKIWLPVLSSGFVICGAMAGSPAKALPPCQNGILVSQIVLSGTYSCDIETISYYFNSSFSELAANPTAAIYFSHSPMVQTISFQNLDNYDPVVFNFEMLSPLESILGIDQTYQYLDPNTAPPETPPTGVASSIPIPTVPSALPFTVDVNFSPDYANTPPDPTITKLTYTIHKTPAPVPLLGAGLLFAYQRKLRRRIKLTS